MFFLMFTPIPAAKGQDMLLSAATIVIILFLNLSLYNTNFMEVQSQVNHWSTS